MVKCCIVLFCFQHSSKMCFLSFQFFQQKYVGYVKKSIFSSLTRAFKYPCYKKVFLDENPKRRFKTLKKTKKKPEKKSQKKFLE